MMIIININSNNINKDNDNNNNNEDNTSYLFKLPYLFKPPDLTTLNHLIYASAVISTVQNYKM